MIRSFPRDIFWLMAGRVLLGRSAYRIRDTMLLIALCVGLFARQAPAEERTCQPKAGPEGRPSIGVVLSGGGARGYAHLGVLQVLEENRIPVDCIAGTSMGAVVGGLYASGMSAANLQQRLSQINLVDITFDVNERADLPQLLREDERSYVSNLSFGFDHGRFKLPVGLVQGNRFQALLQDLTSSIPGNLQFDRLPIPYRAIATDLRTGQMVVLDHGSLPQAIRASMALPGLFAPTEVEGRTLVDGGLVSNLPIETARGMGANVIIAVDIGSPLRPLDALASPADVMQQMVGILIHQNVAQQRQQLRPGDTLIEPQLGSFSFMDFANASQAIAAGAAAARAALPKLLQYQLSPEQYAAYRAAHMTPVSAPIKINHIEVKTRGLVPAQRISDYLQLKPGDVYDAQAVNKKLLEISAGGDFESVTQQLVSDGDEHNLVVNAREKSWGPNFLLFGLGLSSSSDDEGGFRLNIGYRRPWLTQSGLELRVDSVLGSDLLNFHTELRQPLSDSLGYYVAPYVMYQRRYFNYYDGDVKLTQYHMQSEQAGVDLGLPIAHLGDFRVGIAYAYASGTPTYNFPLDPSDGGGYAYNDFTGRQLTVRTRFVIDQLDDALFPRSGYFTELRAERSLFAQTNSYAEVYGKALLAASLGRHTINASIEGGSDIDGNNPTNPLGFTLGGFQHLSAYATDELAGNSMVYGQMTYMNQLATFDAAPIRGLYAGVSAEVGNVWSRIDGLPSGPLKRSITFFTAATSSFGPIYVGVAFAPSGRYNIYFQLGHTY